MQQKYACTVPAGQLAHAHAMSADSQGPDWTLGAQTASTDRRRSIAGDSFEQAEGLYDILGLSQPRFWVVKAAQGWKHHPARARLSSWQQLVQTVSERHVAGRLIRRVRM